MDNLSIMHLSKNYYCIIMKNIILLSDLAKSNAERNNIKNSSITIAHQTFKQQLNEQSISLKTINNSRQIYSKKPGLQTILDWSQSFISSHAPIKKSYNTKSTGIYEQIQKLKKKRIQIQQKALQIIEIDNKKQIFDEIDNSKFYGYLKNQIKKEKGQKLLKKIKKCFNMIILREIKSWYWIQEKKKRDKFGLCRIMFEEWKQYLEQQKQKDIIMEAVKQRLKIKRFVG